jgi:hypothetical protein
VFELLGVDDEMKEKFTKKELFDMCEYSDYSFKGYQESNEKNEDEIKLMMEQSGAHTEPNNIMGFIMN